MLNDRDFAALKDNVKAIEEYCLSLVPDVRKTISVTFGEMTTRRGNYGMPVREPKYEFVIAPSGVWGWSGSLRYDFEKPTSDTATWMYGRGFGESYMLALIKEWRCIKSMILSDISRQKREVSAIHSFTL